MITTKSHRPEGQMQYAALPPGGSMAPPTYVKPEPQPPVHTKPVSHEPAPPYQRPPVMPAYPKPGPGNDEYGQRWRGIMGPPGQISPPQPAVLPRTGGVNTQSPAVMPRTGTHGGWNAGGQQPWGAPQAMPYGNPGTGKGPGQMPQREDFTRDADQYAGLRSLFRGGTI